MKTIKLLPLMEIETLYVEEVAQRTKDMDSKLKYLLTDTSYTSDGKTYAKNIGYEEGDDIKMMDISDLALGLHSVDKMKNLIVDMVFKGASPDEIEKIIKQSMTVIDVEKRRDALILTEYINKLKDADYLVCDMAQAFGRTTVTMRYICDMYFGRRLSLIELPYIKELDM